MEPELRRTLSFGGVILTLSVIACLGLGLWIVRAQRDQALIAKHAVEFAHDSLAELRRKDGAIIAGRLAAQVKEIVGLRDSLKRVGQARATTTIVVSAPPASARDTTPAVTVADTITTEDAFDVGAGVVAATVTVVDTVADWAWTFQPTAIPLTVEIGCRGRLDPDVLVRVPDWVELDSVGTTVTTDVCGPAVKLPGNIFKQYTPWVAGGAVLGIFLTLLVTH